MQIINVDFSVVFIDTSVVAVSRAIFRKCLEITGLTAALVLLLMACGGRADKKPNMDNWFLQISMRASRNG
ncbi:hypothetical protein C8256_07210 [Kluyvera genomosp. 2]|uniref:Uncharacterized protein n=1 Tax=Kluyvera genomosp. 2 TaxID=2774054 RepID=A0A2T2Y4F9_9ENTR|nr:hypothetical protein C8256_07210 [Kluyvera genomosp. 2]